MDATGEQLNAMGRPKLLDLFCGAGGCAVGYHRAGFDVTGVDNRPMPRYPFAFVQGDALAFVRKHGREFDAIHASPPCQRYTAMLCANPEKRTLHPDLVEPTRIALARTRRPWVIENVPGAPLFGAAKICGSAFGLLVRRHRMFLASFFLFGTTCNHKSQKGRFPRGVGRKIPAGRKEFSSVVSVWGGDGGGKGSKALWERAMGIDWMTRAELAQAIPPAYTEYVGRQLIDQVRV